MYPSLPLSPIVTSTSEELTGAPSVTLRTKESHGQSRESRWAAVKSGKGAYWALEGPVE